jgi:uncharacterized protein YndB with AHSA1/START domain
MLQTITTEHIAAPPAVVWAFISDLPRIPEWVVGTKAMLHISTAQVGVGTEYRELTQIGPTTSQTTWRITTFRAPSMQIHESRSALLDAVLTMTLEAENGGTRFINRIEGHLLPRVRPLGWLLERLIRRQAANDMRKTLWQAKQIIEQEYGAVERMHAQPLQAERVVRAS